MGVFSIPVRVKLGAGVQETDVGVDTGSLYTVFPGELLERLGVERRYPNIDFSAADNRILPRDVGLAWIEIDGEWVDELVGDRWVPMTGRVLESPLFVVFGHDGDEVLLGAHLLEGLRLAVDPPRERLLSPKTPLSIRSRVSVRSA